jgi:hypothetical protein
MSYSKILKEEQYYTYITRKWYSDIVKEEQEEQEQKRLDEDKKMVELFNKEYSDISFNRLQKQKPNTKTDDGAIHYFDKETQTIFSYEFNKKYWYSRTENASSYKLYLKLFDNYENENNNNIGNEELVTLTEPPKDLDNSIQCVLDPLSVIIKLAILSNKPVGTKLLIKDNVVYFQEPRMFQSFCRKLYNSNKNDIQYLYNPIHKACSYFLSKNYNGTNVEQLNQIKNLFVCAQNGLKKLMETYQYSNIIVITLNYFYVLMTNHLNQTFNESMFLNDPMTSKYTSLLCYSLNRRWNEDKIKVVLGLINYSMKEDLNNENNAKLLNTFMKTIDYSTHNKIFTHFFKICLYCFCFTCNNNNI